MYNITMEQMVVQKSRNHSEDEIIHAIMKTRGNISLAADAIGVTRWAIYKRMKDSEAIKTAVKQAREEIIDLAESKLRIAVMNGEPWAISLTLKTIGKDRGYVDRKEYTGQDGEAISHKVILTLPHNYRDENENLTIVDAEVAKEITDGISPDKED